MKLTKYYESINCDEFFFSLLMHQEFVQGLSILSRGSMDEKLQWTFSLYDINGDGYITRDEMTDIVTAIYELMGRHPDSAGPEEEKIKDKVEKIFQVSDAHFRNFISLLTVF